MRFTNTIRIRRPREVAFAYLADLADLENLPRWNYAIQQTRKVTPGAVDVGSRFHQVRTVPARQEESLEVVELDPGRRLTVSGTLNTLPGLLGYVLDAEGHTTVLTKAVELSTSGPLSLVAPLASRQIKAAVAANLEVLRQVIEG
jgi:hypothetical protein